MKSGGYIKILPKKYTKVTIGFTGPRPKKLYGYDWNSKGNRLVIHNIRMAILDFIQSKEYDEYTFICGGALGVDQMAFESLIDLKERLYPKYRISLILAIPYRNQPNKWPNGVDVNRYERHIELADYVVYVDQLTGYTFRGVQIGIHHPKKLLIRNKYIVDKSEYIMAVWDGKTGGGTGHCVNYALEKGIKVIKVPIDRKYIIGRDKLW